MTKKKKFKTVRDLASRLEDDAGLYSFSNRFLFAFAERKAASLAEAHFETLTTEAAYEKLLDDYLQSIQDYDDELERRPD